MKKNEKALSLSKSQRGWTKKKKSKLVLLCTLMIFLISVITSNLAVAQPSGVSLAFDSSASATAPCTFVIELTDTTILAIEVGLGSNRQRGGDYLQCEGRGGVAKVVCNNSGQH